MDLERRPHDVYVPYCRHCYEAVGYVVFQTYGLISRWMRICWAIEGDNEVSSRSTSPQYFCPNALVVNSSSSDILRQAAVKSRRNFCRNGHWWGKRRTVITL